MRAPAFWNITEGRDAAFVLRTLLLPFSWLYDFATQNRLKKGENFGLSAKTISIGNISLGGTGKTPLARFIGKHLSNDQRIAIVSRGYGGELIGPIKVSPETHNAKEVGDEPLMLSKDLPVFIGKDRKSAALLAIENGAHTIVLDDFHQNNALKKDIAIVVIDGAVGFGNGLICPAGPLREKPKAGLGRADIVVWIGDKGKLSQCNIAPEIPIFFANIRPIKKELSGKYLAFCGIGRPEKFLDSLVEIGAKPIDLIPFPDHHFFSNQEIKDLIGRADSEGAKLITTEKDFVRIDKDLRKNIEVLEIEITFEDENGFLATLQKSIKLK